MLLTSLQEATRVKSLPYTNQQEDYWTCGKSSVPSRCLYLITLNLADDLRQEHGFELDAFFEPHVLAWLKDTEGSQTQEWVSRAVGMDSVSHLSQFVSSRLTK